MRLCELKMKMIFIFMSTLSLVACGSDDEEKVGEEQSTLQVKDTISNQLDQLLSAAQALRTATPAPDADGWNCTADKAACDSMKEAWKKARAAYERVEGAIAVLFPDLDASTDARYEDFLEECEDINLFDGECVTGVHAIERLLWAGEHPAEVTAFESQLPGYKAAAFPTTMQQATDFRESLVGKLVADAEKMKSDFRPLALDASAAFRGVIGSMGEQLEKVHLAATGEDESRYAQHTLADMRYNLEGGQSTYNAFRKWLLTLDNGKGLDTAIQAGFNRINERYTTLKGQYGDSLPTVPATWESDNPSAADQMSDYGQLLKLLNDEANADNPQSLVSQMNKAADGLGIPQLPE